MTPVFVVPIAFGFLGFSLLVGKIATGRVAARMWRRSNSRQHQKGIIMRYKLAVRRILQPLSLVLFTAVLTACSDVDDATMKPLGDFGRGKETTVIAARGSGTKNLIVALVGDLGFRQTTDTILLTIEDGRVSHRSLGFKIPDLMDVKSFALDGSVIVGHTAMNAVVLNNGKPMFLPAPGRDASSSCAYWVSEDGRTIVGYCGFGLRREAVRWRDGNPQVLGQLLGGMDRTEARWISDDGQIILGQSDGRDGDSVVRLGEGQPKPLPRLTDMTVRCEVTAASATGDVIIGELYSKAEEQWVHYCIWPGMPGYFTLGEAAGKAKATHFLHLISGNGSRAFGWVQDMGLVVWPLEGKPVRLDELLPKPKPDDADAWDDVHSIMATNADGTLLLVNSVNKAGRMQPCLVRLAKSIK